MAPILRAWLAVMFQHWHARQNTLMKIQVGILNIGLADVYRQVVFKAGFRGQVQFQLTDMNVKILLPENAVGVDVVIAYGYRGLYFGRFRRCIFPN